MATATEAMANHIDFFDEAPFTLVLLQGDGDGQESITTTDPDGDTIIGNTRFAQVTFNPGPAVGVVLGANLASNGSTFVFSNSAASRGTLNLRYGDTADLNVVNAVNYTAFGIDVDALDDDFVATVFVMDTASAGGDSDSQMFTISSTGQFLIPYSAFNSNVDFTSLDSLQFSFVSATPGADITLNEITREFIPEPASFALLGLGGMLLMGRRRKA